MGAEAGIVLAVALLSAALMGMAIQRGATCMVAAVDDALTRKRYGRAGALVEAALWAGGLVAVATLAGWIDDRPGRFMVTWHTIAGGVLLGLGAWINRACVFGAVARIGSGQWAWLATPVGFFVGCLVPVESPVPSRGHPTFEFYAWFALAFALLALWRIVEAGRSRSLLSHIWHPHRATLTIACTFVITMLTVGAWAYTDALVALARPGGSMDPLLALRAAMVFALFGGAVLGGWAADLIRLQRPQFGDVLRCLLGGALMGTGSVLVPGSNDGLIMHGLPMLLPHAWVAVAVMAITIAAALAVSKLLDTAARTPAAMDRPEHS